MVLTKANLVRYSSNSWKRGPSILILKVIEPRELAKRIRQINVDEGQDKLSQILREGGKHVDELMILPGDEIIIVEQATKPCARDGEQALETLRRLSSIGKKVIAVITVAKKEFHKRDVGLIAGALTSKCRKRSVEFYLRRQGPEIQGTQYPPLSD